MIIYYKEILWVFKPLYTATVIIAEYCMVILSCLLFKVLAGKITRKLLS